MVEIIYHMTSPKIYNGVKIARNVVSMILYNNFDNHFLNQSEKGQKSVCLYCLVCIKYSVVQL